jgi:sigma-B regulation protein RsbU (phosphoserine phosphatase)
MFQFLKDIFRMVTGELTSNEFERLVTGETRGMFEFYRRHASSVENERRPIMRGIKLGAYLFRAFLSKLTPARRFVYALSVVVFLVGYNNGSFSQMMIAFVAVSFLLAMEVAEKLVTRDELALARGIQESLHPSHDIKVPGFEMITVNEVAREVGGDFLDLIPVEDQSTLALVGDVSGKGISSALYAVKAQTALQLFARETSDPRSLLGRLNTHLYHQIKRGYFLTAVVARMYSDGRVQCCRAGHLPAMVYRVGEKKAVLLESRGVAIGMTPTANGNGSGEAGRGFAELADLVNIELSPGDLLLLYSDGLLETEDRSGRQFGADRLSAVLDAFHREPLPSLREHLVQALHSFRDGTEMKDDTTLILLRRQA